MAQTLTNADAALKDFYEPGIREQLNNDIPLLAQLDKNSQDIEGRQAIVALHGARSSGVGARAENGTLPTAGNQAYADVKVPLKSNYGRIQLSGQVIKAMASDRGSFVRAVDSESKGITNDLKVDVHRQLWGTSDGKIATCGTTTASATVQLATTTSAVQLRELYVGMVVDIGTVASPTTVVSATTISAIDTTNKTITIGSSVTTSASHFIFRSGAGGSGASQKELTGLQTIVASSGTLFSVDPTTTAGANWISTVDSNSGTNRALSENLMAKNMQAVQIAGGEYPDMFIASDGVFRSYANLLTSQKRFSNTTSLPGGYSGLEFVAGGPQVPVVWDRFAPSNKMFLITKAHLVEYQYADWQFMQEDGHVLFRVANTDAYEATLFKYHELCTDKRSSLGLISDITEA